jgi:GT2 family glycosyltransferase
VRAGLRGRSSAGRREAFAVSSPSPAASTDDPIAELFSIGPLLVLIWRPDGNPPRRFDVLLEDVPLAKPYLAMRLAGGTLAVVATTGGTPFPAAPDVQVAGPDGVALLRLPAAQLTPLESLLESPGRQPELQTLIARTLQRAPGLVPHWDGAIAARLAAILQRSVGSAAGANGVGSVATGRVPAEVKRPPSPRVRIESVHGRYVTGWAGDPTAPERALDLVFHVDGRPAGRTTADDTTGDPSLPACFVNHRFTVNLRQDAVDPGWNEQFALRVSEAESGAVLLDGFKVRYARDEESGLLAALTARLHALERALDSIRRELPAVRRHVAHALADYDVWYREVYATIAEQDRASRDRVPAASIAVVIPVRAGSTLRELQTVLDSVAGQPGGAHRLFVVNFDQPDAGFQVLVHASRTRIPHATWIDAQGRAIDPLLAAISRRAGTSHCLFLRTGEYLAPGALDDFAAAIDATGARLLYADSDSVDRAGRHCLPELRPDYNFDLLLANPYVGAFAIDTGWLGELAVQVSDAADSVWQYDLLLAVAFTGEPNVCAHVTRILTHRPLEERANPPDVRAALAGVLRGHLAGRRQRADVQLDERVYAGEPALPHDASHAALRVKWPLPAPPPRVSIVVPTRNGGAMLARCVDSIRAVTRYTEYEILVVDHASDDPATLAWLARAESAGSIRLLRYEGAFNWSAINNFAAGHAVGSVLCFLNDDTEAIDAGWLAELVGHLCRPGVGAAGPRLQYPDGRMQHGGIVLGAHGVAEHAFTGLPDGRPGYLMRAAVVQTVAAVTGACMVCRREVFEQVGGFDMVNLAVAYNDVDFCLRLQALGLRVVWTPHARLVHLGGQTLGSAIDEERRRRTQAEADYMQARWADRLARDPYYHPAFERSAHPYTHLAAGTYSALPERLQ